MFFRHTLDIPANTAKTDPLELVADLTHGIITRVMVGFPRGAAGLAHVRILRGGHQVWPTNPEEDFAWDNFVFNFEENYELYDQPYQLTIQGYNLDECYPHEVMVCFGVHTTPMPFLSRILSGIFGGTGRGGE